jgi:hypothetical protein
MLRLRGQRIVADNAADKLLRTSPFGASTDPPLPLRRSTYVLIALHIICLLDLTGLVHLSSLASDACTNGKTHPRKLFHP